VYDINEDTSSLEEERMLPSSYVAG